jgi:hypothetical protein
MQSNKPQKKKNNQRPQQKPQGQKSRPARNKRKGGGQGGQIGTAMSTGRVASRVTQIRVSRRERLATLTSPVSGTGNVYAAYINAGNIAGGTTSYLGRQAQLFDKYQFRKLSFVYVPVVATTTGGNVIIGTDITPNDATPADASGMTNLSGGYAEGNIWRGFRHEMQTFAAYSTGPKLVRASVNQLGSTATLYDTCAAFVFVEGAPASTVIGYLDVEYDVDLIGVNRNPVTGQTNALTPVGQATVLIPGVTITPATNYPATSLGSFSGMNFNLPATTALLNNATLTSSVDWGTVPITTLGAGTITLPAGTYKIDAQFTYASDTYANGFIRLNCATYSTGFLKLSFGSSSATYPATAYVNTATASGSAVIVLPITDTINIQNAYYYSATSNANQTWNIVTRDQAGVPMSKVIITLLAAAD